MAIQSDARGKGRNERRRAATVAPHTYRFIRFYSSLPPSLRLSASLRPPQKPDGRSGEGDREQWSVYSRCHRTEARTPGSYVLVLLIWVLISGSRQHSRKKLPSFNHQGLRNCVSEVIFDGEIYRPKFKGRGMRIRDGQGADATPDSQR